MPAGEESATLPPRAPGPRRRGPPPRAPRPHGAPRARRGAAGSRTLCSSFRLLHVPMLTGEAAERLTEQTPTSREPGHDRPGWAAQHLADLLVVQAFEIRENDGLPEDQLQRLERPVHIPVQHRLEELLLRVRPPPTRLRDAFGRRLPRRRIVLEHLVRALPDPVEERVPENREEPGAAVGARVEAVEAPEGAQKGLLHPAFPLRPVVGEPESAPVERIQMDEGHLLELPGPVCPTAPATK